MTDEMKLTFPRRFKVGDIVFMPAFTNYDGTPVERTSALRVVATTVVGGYCPHYRLAAVGPNGHEYHEGNERYFQHLIPQITGE